MIFKHGLKSYTTIVLTLLLLLACQTNTKSPLMIATAANMQFVMEELIIEFEKESGVHCEAVISSSGKLTAQIKQGAPYHIFVSANMKYPEELYNSDLTTGEPSIYAYGKLVMCTMIDDLELNPELLKSKKIKHIAIANPTIAPYGMAAIDYLNSFNLTETIKHKFVFGESIAQTNQFITTEAAEIGFTAKSVVLSTALKDQINFINISPELYNPIEQGVVILKKKSEQDENAQKFYNFLFSKKAQELLIKYGYAINE